MCVQNVIQTNPRTNACVGGCRPHTATRVASSSRGARVPSATRSRHPSSVPFAFASSLSLSLSLSRARDDERGTVRVASRRPVDARRARAPIERDARATDERWWRSLSALRLDADARARRDDTVTRDDQRRRRGCRRRRERVEEGCVVVVVVVFERWIDVAFVSFLSSRVVPRTDRPFLAARETGGLSKSRVVVESDGFTTRSARAPRARGVTIAEPLWNGRGKDARALVRVNASNASAMSSGEARGREDFHEKLPNDMPRMSACNCWRACRRSAGPSCHS